MKRLIILFPLLCIVMARPILAQNMNVSTGFGYYEPEIYKGEGSNIFFTDIIYKLPTDFFIGVGFGISDVYTEYSDFSDLFFGYRVIENFYHFRVLVAREFEIGKRKRFVLKPGTGITYIQRRYAKPEVLIDVDEGSGEVWIYSVNDRDNREQDDAGMFLTLDYEYRLNRIGIGIHTEAHILLNIGLGGYVVAPMLSFNF